MLLIGSSHRQLGKTTLACEVLQKFSRQHSIVAIKITNLHEMNLHHANIVAQQSGRRLATEHYFLCQEVDAGSDKDSGRLLAAGAREVYWLLTHDGHLEEGWRALSGWLADDALLVCEATSLRRFVEPGVFLLLEHPSRQDAKQSTQAVRAYADSTIPAAGGCSLDRLSILHGRWCWKQEATAIIMAGGSSKRMMCDKCFMPVGALPLIEHVRRQLEPHFGQLLVSANDPTKFAFLGLPVVADRIPGIGPLMGIASAVAVSAHDRNFVIACDIPDVPIGFVKHMLQEIRGYDAVVPMSGQDMYEPLCAVYRKTALPIVQNALAAGQHRVMQGLAGCRLLLLPWPTDAMLVNLNTISDYKDYMRTWKLSKSSK